jgi:uncharacterized lipoprotein
MREFYNMRSLAFISLLCAATLLSGCAYITKTTGLQSSDKQYLNAKSAPPLRIPPGISSSAFENYYPVPDHQYPESAKVVSVVPPGLMDKK